MRRFDAAFKMFLPLALACGLAARADESRPFAQRKVAIVLYDGVEILDFAGPTEVFTAAGNGAFRVYTVAATHAQVLSQGVLKVQPDYSVEDAPTPDILVLPGGNSRAFTRSEAGMAWVKKVTAKNELSMSVCTGAFILAELGLLDGRPATTHWGAISGMRSAYPKVQVKTDVRFVDDGRIVTTAGVSAGIDGALHVVQRLLGDDVAWETARYMQYVWEPKKSAALPDASKEGLRALVFGDGERAVSLLSAEAAKAPRDSQVLSRLGRAQLLRGETKTAIQTLESAVALGDFRPITLVALGNAQLATNANAAAESTFTELVKQRGAPADAYNLACAQGRQGKVDAAIASLDKAVALGFSDRGIADGDADLRAVRGDPRYAQLFTRSP
ncbi:MAG TPA: DJ-1/PfpI family protein [Myxococcaceae bacterium]|nr:DJ-1/PfpI family protein [Myxococcaceae bacterium]